MHWKFMLKYISQISFTNAFFHRFFTNGTCIITKCQKVLLLNITKVCYKMCQLLQKCVGTSNNWEASVNIFEFFKNNNIHTSLRQGCRLQKFCITPKTLSFFGSSFSHFLTSLFLLIRYLFNRFITNIILYLKKRLVQLHF